MIHLFRRRNSETGQATTELAILGSILIMAFAYLLQQGYIYNCRQALEMYTFRKALQLSQTRDEERGITLTVTRDIISPSFFTGLNRQQLSASASVDHNPYILYMPYKEDPEDIGTLHLMQVGDAMIRNNYFIQVPPTLMYAKKKDEDKGEWSWTNSTIFNKESPLNTSEYAHTTYSREGADYKTISKTLNNIQEARSTEMTFEDKQSLIAKILQDDWKGEIESTNIEEPTIPKPVRFYLNEQVWRAKGVQTPH